MRAPMPVKILTGDIRILFCYSTAMTFFRSVLMKNVNFILFFTSLLWLSNSQAYNYLTAHALEDVVAEASQHNFRFIGEGKLNGYNLTKACLYSNGLLGNKNLLILKHYCHKSGKNIPRSYTVVSKQLGIISFYEEYTTLCDGCQSFYKRVFTIQQFPEVYNEYMGRRPQPSNISEVNKILNYFSNVKGPAINNPACFATNSGDGTNSPTAQCINTSIDNFYTWREDLIGLLIEGMSSRDSRFYWNNALDTLHKILQIGK